VLLVGVAVDGAAGTAAGQQFAVGFVGGGAVYGTAHHLHAHAAQPIGQQGTGCSSIILMEQGQAKQVVGLGLPRSATAEDQDNSSVEQPQAYFLNCLSVVLTPQEHFYFQPLRKFH
jgi:hypothetical protein